MEWFTSLDEATSHLTLLPETRKRLRSQLELLGLTRDWPDDKVFKLDDGWEND